MDVALGEPGRTMFAVLVIVALISTGYDLYLIASKRAARLGGALLVLKLVVFGALFTLLGSGEATVWSEVALASVALLIVVVDLAVAAILGVQRAGEESGP